MSGGWTVLCIVLLLLPVVASAQGLTFQWENYLGFSTIEDVLLALLNVFIVIATPIIILFIIYAGFLYVTARGNAQQVQQASRALTYAIIGGILIIGAVAIAGIFGDIVASFTP